MEPDYCGAAELEPEPKTVEGDDEIEPVEVENSAGMESESCGAAEIEPEPKTAEGAEEIEPVEVENSPGLELGSCGAAELVPEPKTAEGADELEPVENVNGAGVGNDDEDVDESYNIEDLNAELERDMIIDNDRVRNYNKASRLAVRLRNKYGRLVPTWRKMHIKDSRRWNDDEHFAYMANVESNIPFRNKFQRISAIVRTKGSQQCNSHHKSVRQLVWESLLRNLLPDLLPPQGFVAEPAVVDADWLVVGFGKKS